MTPSGAAGNVARMTQRRDLLRQVAVISAVCFMIVAALVGTGLLGGTNIRDVQGGALDADGSYLAPARSAFSIWSVIYVLFLAYTLWQALPGQRTRRRQRYAGWWIAATAVLNGLWLLAAQFANLLTTVIAIIVLLATLGLTLRVLTVHPAEGPADLVLMDLAVGLHLGWVALATVANIGAWLTAEVVPASWGSAAAAWGIGVLTGVAGIGIAIAWATDGRFPPGVAMAWGLVWIGVARATGEPASAPIAVAAWIAATAVLVAPAVRRILLRRAQVVSTSRSS